MVYPNLRAEMARAGIGADGIAMWTGLSIASVYRRLKNGGFTLEEARTIQARLFPKLTIDYLFETEGGESGSGQDCDDQASG